MSLIGYWGFDNISTGLTATSGWTGGTGQARTNFYTGVGATGLDHSGNNRHLFFSPGSGVMWKTGLGNTGLINVSIASGLTGFAADINNVGSLSGQLGGSYTGINLLPAGSEYHGTSPTLTGDYINGTAGETGLILYQHNFSCSVWCYFDHNQYSKLSSKTINLQGWGGSGLAGWQFIISNNIPTISFNGLPSTNDRVYPATTTLIQKSGYKWTKLEFTLDWTNKIIKFYQDGIKLGNDVSCSNLITNYSNPTLFFNALPTNIIDSTSGYRDSYLVDEIKVYDSTLSISEIQNNYLEDIQDRIDITTQPINTSSFVGNNTTLSIIASGEGLSYQWYLNGNLIPSATSSTYIITDPQISNNGDQYYCIVSNTYGSITSNIITLTVVGSSIITQPQAILQYAGTTGTWTAGVTGGTRQYQWYVGTTGVPGATGITYYRLLTMSDDGLYAKLRIYNNTLSSYVDSNSVLIDVVTPWGGVTGPSDIKVKTGNNATFQPIIASGEPVSYQWYVNDGGVTGAIAGATGLSYTFSVTGTNDTNRYFADISDPIATYRTYAALLTVNGAMIPTNPTSFYYFRGETGIFTDGVTGGIGPYTYQWQRKDN